MANEAEITEHTNLTDEQVVKLVLAGNQEQYREIVGRFHAKLLRYAITLIGNKDKAEDVVQETFIKAFVNLQSFDPTKKFSSWLYRIAHNEAINNIRKYHREVSLEENELLVGKMASSQNVLKEVIKNENGLAIGECILKLPPKYSEPLELFYIGEKSYEEISDILRLPISTVGVRINRAKQMAKKICINLEGKI